METGKVRLKYGIPHHILILIYEKSILQIQQNMYFPVLSKGYQLKSLVSRCQKTCYNPKLIQNLTNSINSWNYHNRDFSPN